MYIFSITLSNKCLLIQWKITRQVWKTKQLLKALFKIPQENVTKKMINIISTMNPVQRFHMKNKLTFNYQLAAFDILKLFQH